MRNVVEGTQCHYSTCSRCDSGIRTCAECGIRNVEGGSQYHYDTCPLLDPRNRAGHPDDPPVVNPIAPPAAREEDLPLQH
jgi:hypothetical protein